VRLAEASRPDPALTGFRLMPLGSYSLDARVELARRATRSLDLQYYHIANDRTGRLLLRHVRDAALRGVRRSDPKRLVLAVPVAPPDTVESLQPEVDELVCLSMPFFFHAVGQFYEDFSQTTDEEVVELLEAARRQMASARRETTKDNGTT